MKWISVKEKLPKEYENVLCNDNDVVVIGSYIDEEIGWHDTHSYRIYPTHWMPLPPAPDNTAP